MLLVCVDCTSIPYLQSLASVISFISVLTFVSLSLRSFNQDFISYTWVHLWAFKAESVVIASWIRVGGRLIRVSYQLDQTYMDSHVVTLDHSLLLWLLSKRS
ncbi:hypothetical protein AAG906_006908 [Vitis piasezkii]